MKLKEPTAPPIEINKKTQRPLKLTKEELLNHLKFEEEATAADIETCKHKFSIYWDDIRSHLFILLKSKDWTSILLRLDFMPGWILWLL